MDKIVGERVYLRKLTPNDITERYLSWFRDGTVTDFLEAKNLTRSDVVEYILTGEKTGIYTMYALCTVDDDLHIGNVKLGPINLQHRTADLVTVIGDRTFWGKGLATEAIRLGNRVAFEHHDIRKLHGGMYANNIGSIKAYTRAGWTIEGHMVGQLLHEGGALDKVLVACFNPKYFVQIDETWAVRSTERGRR